MLSPAPVLNLSDFLLALALVFAAVRWLRPQILRLLHAIPRPVYGILGLAAAAAGFTWHRTGGDAHLFLGQCAIGTVTAWYVGLLARRWQAAVERWQTEAAAARQAGHDAAIDELIATCQTLGVASPSPRERDAAHR